MFKSLPVNKISCKIYKNIFIKRMFNHIQLIPVALFKIHILDRFKTCIIVIVSTKSLILNMIKNNKNTIPLLTVNTTLIAQKTSLNTTLYKFCSKQIMKTQ